MFAIDILSLLTAGGAQGRLQSPSHGAPDQSGKVNGAFSSRLSAILTNAQAPRAHTPDAQNADTPTPNAAPQADASLPAGTETTAVGIQNVPATAQSASAAINDLMALLESEALTLPGPVQGLSSLQAGGDDGRQSAMTLVDGTPGVMAIQDGRPDIVLADGIKVSLKALEEYAGQPLLRPQPQQQLGNGNQRGVQAPLQVQPEPTANIPASEEGQQSVTPRVLANSQDSTSPTPQSDAPGRLMSSTTPAGLKRDTLQPDVPKTDGTQGSDRTPGLTTASDRLSATADKFGADRPGKALDHPDQSSSQQRLEAIAGRLAERADGADKAGNQDHPAKTGNPTEDTDSSSAKAASTRPVGDPSLGRTDAATPTNLQAHAATAATDNLQVGQAVPIAPKPNGGQAAGTARSSAEAGPTPINSGNGDVGSQVYGPDTSFGNRQGQTQNQGQGQGQDQGQDQSQGQGGRPDGDQRNRRQPMARAATANRTDDSEISDRSNGPGNSQFERTESLEQRSNTMARPTPPTHAMATGGPAVPADSFFGMSQMSSYSAIAGGLEGLQGDGGMIQLSSNGQASAPSQHGGTTGSPAHQVAMQINKAVTAGETKFTIRLNPPELGRIQVRMEFNRDGAMRATVTAESRDTLDLLQRDVRHLERTLQDAGIKTESGGLNFSLNQGQQQNAQQAFANALDQDGSNPLEGEDGDESGEGHSDARDAFADAEDGEDVPLEAILANATAETGLDIKV